MYFHNYTTFPKSPTNYVSVYSNFRFIIHHFSKIFQVKLTSIMLCNILGALCIFLNMFVIFALLRNRRRVLANVFYVLVLHCAIVDLIRGGCLIAWGMPHLLINNMKSMDDRLMALKVCSIHMRTPSPNEFRGWGGGCHSQFKMSKISFLAKIRFLA